LVISDQSEEPVPMKYKRSGDVTKWGLSATIQGAYVPEHLGSKMPEESMALEQTSVSYKCVESEPEKYSICYDTGEWITPHGVIQSNVEYYTRGL
jgi:hypothetical protein